MAYEFFYDENNLKPFKSPYLTGYMMSAGEAASSSLDPRTANQLQEFSRVANLGGKTIEVEGLSPEVLDSIPKQHLTEIGRLSKLTGVDATMHGPLVEASGYTQQGWTEAGREQAEKQMFSSIERAQQISPDGNMNVTFHSSVMLPQEEIRMKEGGEEVLKGFVAVDPISGQIQQIKREDKYFPEQDKYKEFSVGSEIDRLNKENWFKILNNIDYHAHIGEETLKGTVEMMKRRSAESLGIVGREITPEEEKKVKERENALFRDYSSGKIKYLPDKEQQQFSDTFRNLDHSRIFLKDSYNSLRELYNRAYRDADSEDKKKLDDYRKSVEVQIKSGIEDNSEKLQEFANMVQSGIRVLSDIKSPALFKPFDEFVRENSAKTFGNVAFKSYKEFKDKSPIIAIENPPVGGAISRAEDLKKLIEQSRKEFVKKATSEGISEGEAKQAAEKIIGATWDVGHINMLRKYGYEKKDLIKQAEIIAPFVKKVHLSDNFGMEHTELPMGMGNVPIKEIMEKLGKEGYEAKKIVEAGNWFQHFKTPPTAYSLEAFSSPLYGMMMSPYWNQAGGFGSYSVGMGTILPEQNFSIYGSGFTSLPTELGGQIAGKQSRMSGTPMD
jgi:hypothetical protein